MVENEIVGKDDDLAPRLRLFDKPLSDCLNTGMVQRRHRIVDDNAMGGPDFLGFGQKAGECQRSLSPSLRISLLRLIACLVSRPIWILLTPA